MFVDIIFVHVFLCMCVHVCEMRVSEWAGLAWAAGSQTQAVAQLTQASHICNRVETSSPPPLRPLPAASVTNTRVPRSCFELVSVNQGAIS